jgi:hypothetical protein
MPDSDLRALENFNLKSIGKLQLRHGFELYGNISSSDTTAMRAIYQFNNNNTDELITLTNSYLWKNDVSTESTSFTQFRFLQQRR